MNTAARNTMVALALSISGGLLAMNWTPNAAVGTGVVASAFPQASSTSVNTISELVASVDWSKVKQEPLPPTF
jgi:hypothetical protein